MIADAPRGGALLLGIRYLVRLTVNARLHDVIPANGTILNGNVPGPQSNRVPFFHFKSLLYSRFNHFVVSKFSFVNLYL